jgi:lysophospholipase L1-like esterase
MDDVKFEQKIFSKLIHKNFDKLSSFWKPTIPFTYDPNVQDCPILDRLKTEKDIVTEEYKNVEIIYHIGRTGYRLYPTLNDSPKKRIFCFGCSFTFGFGVPDEHTWPYQLVKLLGEDYGVNNYGVNAASMAFISRSYYQIINFTKPEDYPDAVFFLFPDPYRLFHIGNNNEELEIKHYRRDRHAKKMYDDFCKKRELPVDENKIVTSSQVEAFFKFVKYINFIKEISENRKIPWYWHTWNPFLYKIKKDVLEKYIDLSNTHTNELGIVPIKHHGPSRDGTHWNGKTNQAVAEIFHKLKTYG